MDKKLQANVRKAIKHFWATRHQQSSSQRAGTGRRDAGNRTAVTGGKHLDGFTDVCRKICVDAGVPKAGVFWQTKRKLPGFYRAEKD